MAQRIKIKKFPYPPRVLKNREEIREYYEALVWNALEWLKMDGYTWSILLPGETGFVEHKNAGASICVEYPYKKFNISIQQDTYDKALKCDLKSAFWENTESGIFHEILHIITWRGVEIAKQRYVTPTDIDDNDEFTVDHLTHVIYSIVRDLRREQNAKRKK